MNVPALALYPAPLAFVPDVTDLRADFWIPSYPVMRSQGLGSEAGQMAITYAAATGAMLLKAAPATGPAAPFVAAAGAILSLGAAIGNLFHGCGATCIQSSEFANQFQQAVQQLKDYYFAQPVHYRSLQKLTLNEMQKAADALRQACGDPALGDAGKRCIAERLVRGGPAPWCPTPDHTGCGFWETFYDPIANDPNVVEDPPAIQQASDSIGLTTGGKLNWGMVALLGIGLVLLLTFMT